MSYVDEVLAQVETRDANEPLFLQTVREVLNSLRPMIEPNEEKYRKLALLERLVEPEKTVIFRVPWVDDNGVAHVNRGYRVQFNSPGHHQVPGFRTVLQELPDHAAHRRRQGRFRL